MIDISFQTTVADICHCFWLVSTNLPAFMILVWDSTLHPTAVTDKSDRPSRYMTNVPMGPQTLGDVFTPAAALTSRIPMRLLLCHDLSTISCCITLFLNLVPQLAHQFGNLSCSLPLWIKFSRDTFWAYRQKPRLIYQTISGTPWCPRHRDKH